MNALDASDVLRLAVIGGLAGFGVFCASYAAAVWGKRNRVGASRLERVGYVLLILGSAAAAAQWGTTTLARRDGVIDGADLFVVYARRDASLYRVSQSAEVVQGDILAEFVPPAIEAQFAVLDNRVNEARSRLHALKLRSLPVDPVVLQQQTQTRAQLDQARAFSFDLRRAGRELEKDELTHQTSWTRERSQLDAELGAARREAKAHSARVRIAEEAVARAAELLRKNLVAVQVVDDRTAQLIGFRADRDRSQGAVESLEARLAALEDRFAKTAQAFERQRARLQADVEGVESSLRALTGQSADFDRRIARDQERAAVASGSEVEAAQHQLAGLMAERARAVEVTRITAQTSGRVVYRHPSPGLVPEGAPILAVSAGSGFSARIAIPARDIADLTSSPQARIMLDQPTLVHVLPARYRAWERIADDPDRVIARFDVELPPEAITRLATTVGQSLPARLAWHPDLWQHHGVRAGFAVGAFGLLLILLAAVTRGRGRASAAAPATPEASSSASTPVILTPVLALPAPAIDLAPGGREIRSLQWTPSPAVSAIAQLFHRRLRSGQLTPADVIEVEGLIMTRGVPVIVALWEELVFDQELEIAIRQWFPRFPNQRLTKVIAVVKRYGFEQVA